MVLGVAAGQDNEEEDEDEGLVIILEDKGAGMVVIEEDGGAELIYEVEDETAALDDTVEHVEQGGEAPPIPEQNQSRKDKGPRKRVASDSSSNSNASSRDGDSIRRPQGKIDSRTIKAKRKQQGVREGDILERHRHHSVHEVYLE